MNNIRQNKYTAACYARLSVDDEQDGTSVSIETQRKILEDYCTTNCIEVYDYYCDDGYSGTNFNRPAFRKMIEDAENGKINMVIVKDLSRFGRDYIEVGRYIENYFPKKKIRFVAIGDAYDSSAGTNDLDFIVPVKNLFNQYYPAECSRKVRQAFKAKASRGEYIGAFAPYGYKKSEQDKHVLEIDENTSKIVVRIFELIAYHGYGYTKIARMFSSEKILTPMAYRCQREGTSFDKDPYDWNLGSVSAIVQNEIYLGNLVSGKRTTISYKDKSVIKKSREECIVVENKVPPIISRELWDFAHKSIKSRKRENSDENFENIFAGLIRCDKCGKVLGLSGRKNSKDGQSYYYCCETYKKKGKDRCSTHYTLFNDIYDAVLKDIRSVTDMIKSLDPDTDAEVAKALFGEYTESGENETARIAELEKQLEAINDRYDKMYSDRLDGIITPERFKAFAAKEEERAKSLREELERLQCKKQDQENSRASLNSFIEKVRAIGDIRELNANLLNTLIDSITVGERKLEDGAYTQNITINYKFQTN